eukprot:6197462-Pleurochrysis_carterae.AAC.6
MPTLSDPVLPVSQLASSCSMFAADARVVLHSSRRQLGPWSPIQAMFGYDDLASLRSTAGPAASGSTAMEREAASEVSIAAGRPMAPSAWQLACAV